MVSVYGSTTSTKYVESLMILLVKAQIAKSFRGPYGGYQLLKENISALDIFRLCYNCLDVQTCADHVYIAVYRTLKQELIRQKNPGIGVSISDGCF